MINYREAMMSDSTESDSLYAMPHSSELMDEFLCASQRSSGSLREHWLARETLRSIIRLVRSEQLVEIRQTVNRLVPSSLRPQNVKRARPRRNQRKQPGQTQLAFGRDD